MQSIMSQIATTIEQSKRLMKAGLDLERADMYWLGSGKTISPDEDEYKLYTEPFSPLYERVTEAIKNEKADRDNYGFDTSNEIEAKEDFLSRHFPAWSLSALWQIVHELDKTYEFPTTLSSDDLIELLVKTICFRREYQLPEE